MTNRIIETRDQLLEIANKKAELLISVIENIDDILTNNVFMEEIEELYRELSAEEAKLLSQSEITLTCPECEFECPGLASFCMACGRKLHEEAPPGHM